MIKILMFLFVIIFIGGCSIKEISKPISRYDIGVSSKVFSDIRSDKILKVARFKTPVNFFSKKIWYKRRSLKTNSYLYSRWSQDFSTMIEQDVVNMLYKSGVFKSVFNSYSKVRADYVLEGEIVNAIQHVDSNSAYVVFEVRLYLVDYKKSKLVGSKDFSYRRNCRSVNALGAIEAYDSIVKIFNKEVVLWLEKLVIEN